MIGVSAKNDTDIKNEAKNNHNYDDFINNNNCIFNGTF